MRLLWVGYAHPNSSVLHLDHFQNEDLQAYGLLSPALFLERKIPWERLLGRMRNWYMTGPNFWMH